jgi:SHS2 domain-containing protein
MGGFELLDHTADQGLVGRGKDLPEALAWTATGMFSVIADVDAVVPRQSIHISLEAADREALAIDWLNELLFRYEAEGFLPGEYNVSVNDAGTSLEADCAGEQADPDRHRIRTAVKAATYHALEVSHTSGEWRVHVILDI